MRLREREPHTQAELAELLGLTVSGVRWKLQTGKWRDKELEKLALATGETPPTATLIGTEPASSKVLRCIVAIRELLSALESEAWEMGEEVERCLRFKEYLHRK